MMINKEIRLPKHSNDLKLIASQIQWQFCMPIRIDETDILSATRWKLFSIG